VSAAKALVYPFSPLVLVATILTGIASTAIPMILGMACMRFTGALVGMGIEATFFFAIVNHASLGEEGPPRPSEISDPSALIEAGIRFSLAIAVPAILLFVVLPGAVAGVGLMEMLDLQPLQSVPAWAGALGLVWLLYLPASLLLAAGGTGCLGGLNFVGGVQLIARAPASYGLLLLCLVVPVAGMALLSAVMVPFMVAGGITGFVAEGVLNVLLLFPAVAAARMLGLFLYHNAEELGLG
tara:strand:- start:1238 stop:1957 length:720 start_codon:yes stop_codon:yes gene_type:complete